VTGHPGSRLQRVNDVRSLLGGGVQGANGRGVDQAFFGRQTPYWSLVALTVADWPGEDQSSARRDNPRGCSRVSPADPSRGSRSGGDLGGVTALSQDVATAGRQTDHRPRP